MRKIIIAVVITAALAFAIDRSLIQPLRFHSKVREECLQPIPAIPPAEHEPVLPATQPGYIEMNVD